MLAKPRLGTRRGRAKPTGLPGGERRQASTVPRYVARTCRMLPFLFLLTAASSPSRRSSLPPLSRLPSAIGPCLPGANNASYQVDGAVRLAESGRRATSGYGRKSHPAAPAGL